MYTANRECRTCRFCGYPQKGCMAQGGRPRYLPENGCPLYAMSARAFLERVLNAQRRIVSMEQQAAHYRDMATGIRSSCSFSGAYAKGSILESSLEKNVNAFMVICEEIEAEIERLRAYMQEVRSVLDFLPDTREKEILELRYLNGMKWEDISRRMLIDSRHLRRLHDAALEHVQRDMDLMEYARSRPGWNPAAAPTQTPAMQ